MFYYKPSRGSGESDIEMFSRIPMNSAREIDVLVSTQGQREGMSRSQHTHIKFVSCPAHRPSRQLPEGFKDLHFAVVEIFVFCVEVVVVEVIVLV